MAETMSPAAAAERGRGARVAAAVGWFVAGGAVILAAGFGLVWLIRLVGVGGDIAAEAGPPSPRLVALLPALLQWVYVVPALGFSRRRRRFALALGMLVGAFGIITLCLLGVAALTVLPARD